ncbi:MAG: phage major capsid protein [Bdellovibrionales bacterium]|nr:phage major capsid protein [Bdellovibrionales bacterium]
MHGSADDASAAFVGEWQHYTIGMRTALQLEMFRSGGNPDVASRIQVLFRAYLRVDGVAVRPDAFCLIRGLIPPAE